MALSEEEVEVVEVGARLMECRSLLLQCAVEKRAQQPC
jgi:hypothetical protein